MCTSQDHRLPSPGSYVLSHCLPTSVPLHTWLCTSFTPLFMKILPMLADITDATYLFIHSFHKFVLNNSYCQALIWMLRKPCQTSTTSSIFPFFESDLHFYTVKWNEVKVLVQSCPTLCNLWTVARQAPLSMEFSRQEYWSGLPFPSPRDLPGIEPRSPALQADFLPSELPGRPYIVVVPLTLELWQVQGIALEMWETNSYLKCINLRERKLLNLIQFFKSLM